MNKIDMHFHSTNSDGLNPADEILKKAKSKGLEFIALTDHDKISKGFQKKAEKYGIKSCESVEISACDYENKKSLHITCYTDHFSKDISNILEGVIKGRSKKIELQLIKLQEAGFKITMLDVKEICISEKRKLDAINKYDIAKMIYGNTFNRNHLVKINGGIDLSLSKFYDKFFKRKGEMYSVFGAEAPNYELTLDTCKQIKDSSNAVLAIAHPNITYKKGLAEFAQILPNYIKKAGINAIEINSQASCEWVDGIIDLAKKYNLFLTFGSDNHKIGFSDNDHGDFGQLNPHTSDKFIKEEFMKYAYMLGI